MEYSSDNDGEYDDDYYNAGEAHFHSTYSFLWISLCHPSIDQKNISSATAIIDSIVLLPTILIHLTHRSGNEDFDIEHHNALKTDPENFIYDCLSVEDVDKLLNESIECLCNSIKCAPSLAKALLLEHQWSISEIVRKYRENASELLVSGGSVIAVNCSYI